MLDSGEHGWIESDRIRDDRSVARDRWPAPGAQLEAVFLDVVPDQ